MGFLVEEARELVVQEFRTLSGARSLAIEGSSALLKKELSAWVQGTE